MKALVLENNGILKYCEVSEPKMAADECLIKVRNAGICSSDIYRAYDHGAYFYPLIMGHEMAGVVEEIGKKVQNYRRGDRVAIFPLIPCRRCEFCKTEDYAQCRDYDYYGSRRNGAFCDYLAVKEWNLFPIPQDVNLEQAALLEPLAVMLHAAKKISFRKNERVAIFGAGFIGLALVQYLLKMISKEDIYIIDQNPFKLSIAEGYGVHSLNLKKDKNRLKTIMKQTGGFDHVIEACGAVETYGQSLEIVKSHGDILWIGNIAGDLKLTQKTVSSILRRELKIYGTWNSKFTHRKDDDWSQGLQFIKTQSVLNELITHRASLREGESIFERMYLQKLKKIKSERIPFVKVVFEVE